MLTPGAIIRRDRLESHPTFEFTRPRGSGKGELIKHPEKHAIAARVQRFGPPRIVVTRYPSSTGTRERGELRTSPHTFPIASRAKLPERQVSRCFCQAFNRAKAAQRRS